MRAKSRFILSVIKTAQTQAVDMPWTRGKRRSDFIAARALSQMTQSKTNSQLNFA